MSFLGDGWKATQSTLTNTAPYLELLQKSLGGIGTNITNLGSRIQDVNDSAYLNALMRQKDHAGMQDFLNSAQGRDMASVASSAIAKEVAGKLQNQPAVDLNADTYRLNQAKGSQAYARYQADLAKAVLNGNKAEMQRIQQNWANGLYGEATKDYEGRLYVDPKFTEERQKQAMAVNQERINKDKQEESNYWKDLTRMNEIEAHMRQIDRSTPKGEADYAQAKAAYDQLRLRVVGYSGSKERSTATATNYGSQETIDNLTNKTVDEVAQRVMQVADTPEEVIVALQSYSPVVREAALEKIKQDPVYSQWDFENIATPGSEAQEKQFQQQIGADYRVRQKNEEIKKENEKRNRAAAESMQRAAELTQTLATDDPSVTASMPESVTKMQNTAAETLANAVEPTPLVTEDPKPVTPYGGEVKAEDIPKVRAQVDASGKAYAEQFAQSKGWQLVGGEPERDMVSGSRISSVAYTVEDPVSGARYNCIYYVDSTGKKYDAEITRKYPGISAFAPNIPQNAMQLEEDFKQNTVKAEQEQAKIRKAIPGIDYLKPDQAKTLNNYNDVAEAACLLVGVPEDKKGEFKSAFVQRMSHTPELQGLTMPEVAAVMLPFLGPNSWVKMTNNTSMTFGGNFGITDEMVKKAADTLRSNDGKGIVQDFLKKDKKLKDMETAYTELSSAMGNASTALASRNKINPLLALRNKDTTKHYGRLQQQHDAAVASKMRSYLSARNNIIG